MKDISRLLRDRPDRYESRASAKAYECILELAHRASRRHPPLVERALWFIENHLCSAVESRQICRRAGLSTAHLNRVFREEMGMSPMAYVIEKRMERAKALLSTTALRVCEVAEAVGYEDPLYFSTQFKKHVGVSPKFYTTSRSSDDAAVR